MATTTTSPTPTITAEQVKALCEVFSCPGMPVFMLRSKDIEFVCPPEMVETVYQDKLEAIEQKLQEDSPDNSTRSKIVLKSLSPWPDLDFALKLSKSDTFSIFHDDHRSTAGLLIELFLKAPSIDELLSLAVYCRERLNAYLFIYSLSTALLHRPDTRHIRIPDISEHLPAKFVNKSALNDSRRIVYMTKEDRPIIRLEAENAISNVADELKLNYFREDIAISVHHWHWHLTYPTSGPDEIVCKDRRGELFYYMHNQCLKRMDNDRFCRGVAAVLPLLLTAGGKCLEGYFPKLDTSLGSRYICGRPDNAEFRDVLMEGYIISIDQLNMWIDRLRNSISRGVLTLPNDKELVLTPETGIDYIGNLIEASKLSVHPNYYGNLHNYGHLLLSRIHDPNSIYKEEPGVMGDVSTAMRDPIFYRWHKMIDLICREFKLSLPAYSTADFACPGIELGAVTVLKDGVETSALDTFWEWDDINCSRGLDFKSSSPVYFRFKHLNHDEWTFQLTIVNQLAVPKTVSVRIWLVPVSDFTRQNIKLSRAQHLAIEMDKFVVRVSPGAQTVERRSEDSNCTIPFERSFPNRYGEAAGAVPTGDTALCACGWPHHMYLPIGCADGTPFDFVVMLTDFEQDRVDSDDVGGDASIYCGLSNKKYPDRRPMGYPFDRLFDTKYAFLADLVAAFPNMKSTRVNVCHKDEERKGRYFFGEEL